VDYVKKPPSGAGTQSKPFKHGWSCNVLVMHIERRLHAGRALL
jgi:hypothetical protein